ncbi:sigma-70 family RNA polymerase sigma factor [Patescibacteria group bacterium]|nr:sigma-70 family RNA polymerase sigma factor [Patescibacteria group bacterium]
MNPQKQKTNGELTTAYNEYAEALLRYCYHKTHSKDDAQEIVHDTFVNAQEYLEKGNEVENLKAFLFRIANNIIVDRSRKHKNQKRCEIPLESLNEKGVHPESMYGMDLIKRKIEAENILKDVQKTEGADYLLFLLRYIDGLKPTEIAAITGLTPNHVSVRLHRMLKKASWVAKNGNGENKGRAR